MIEMAIGLTGRIGSGKSTTAKFIKNLMRARRDIGVNILQFSEPIKHICQYLFNRNITEDTKNSPVIIPGTNHKNLREVLQILGIDCIRNKIGKDVIVEWQRFHTSRLFEMGDRPLWLVYDDLRFNNEAEFIKEFKNNYIIGLKRDSNNLGQHESERGIEESYIDKWIINNGTLKDLINVVHYFLDACERSVYDSIRKADD